MARKAPRSGWWRIACRWWTRISPAINTGGRARSLGRITLGFGYGVEWPASWQGPRDIDSGVVIPVFEVSAGSSGMAFIAASSFHDWDFLQALATTVNMAGFPSRKNGELRYCASNQVGDAAVLYAAVLGPLWERITKP